MAFHVAQYVASCPEEGQLIQTEIVLIMQGDVAGHHGYSVVGDLLDVLRESNNCFTVSDVAGIHSEGMILNLDGKKVVGLHEGVHKFFYENIGETERSFEESCAYAFEKSAEEKPSALNIDIGRRISLICGEAHQHFAERIANGGLSQNDFQRIEKIAGFIGDYHPKNWAAFLSSVHRARYYALFQDLFKSMDPQKALEIEVVESAKILQEQGLKAGLEYLARFASFNPIILNPGEEYELKQYQHLFTTHPLFHPDFGESGLVCETSSKSVVIHVASSTEEASQALADVALSWKPKLEEVAGEEVRIK